MERNYDENDEIQIDLLELLEALRRRIWLILLALVLGGGAGVAYTKLVITPLYTSTAMVYVLSKETTLTSLADLQIGSQLTNDYRVVVTSRPVLQEVIDNLELEMDFEDLKEQISLENPSDTRILSISVEDPDPYRAKAIVDEVAHVSSQYIGDIMEMVPPKTIEDGVVPEEPSSPNVLKNGVICAVLLAAAVCGVICTRVILNDSIRSEEDVERYLGMTVLASIPKEGQDKGRGTYGRYENSSQEGDKDSQHEKDQKREQEGLSKGGENSRREHKSRRRQPRSSEIKAEEGREKEQ